MTDRSSDDDRSVRLTLRPGAGRAPVTLRVPFARAGDRIYVVPTSEGERWIREAADADVVGCSLGPVDRICSFSTVEADEEAIARRLLEERFGVVGDGERAWPRAGMVFAIDLGGGAVEPD